MSTTRQREPEILSPAQLATVVAAMPDRLKALVLLSAWCGLRWGEVTEVRRKDFSDDCSIVTVSRGVTPQRPMPGRVNQIRQGAKSLDT